MAACQLNSCRLPIDYAALSEENQAKAEAHCAAVNAGEARECARRQRHLVDWINNTDDQPLR
jgi:hypothetical protein